MMALESGYFGYMQKPPPLSHPSRDEFH